jgi:glycosyltransferase involved in cell wall biosynthesis
VAVVRILFVADVSIQGVIGGAERVLYEQATRLARKGHEVHTLTRRPPGDDRTRVVRQGVTEHRYAVDARNPVLFFGSTLRNARRLFASLSHATAFDCIHSHQPFSAAGVLLSPGARSIPKVYSCHSLSCEEFVSRNPPPSDLLPRCAYRLNRLVRKCVERWVLQRCRTVVALSRFSQRRLGEVHGIPVERTTIIPGGVDTETFRPAGDKPSIRRGLWLPTDRVVLFTVRNLVARMGLENLLLAVKAAIPQAPGLFLVIGGAGPLDAALRELAAREGLAERVRFAGFIPESELPSYYQMADLFVLPTRELEGFGLVTLEALACGVPVAGTPVGGTPEILSRLEPKLLFKDATAESMADTIAACYRQVKDHPRQWADLGERCRRFTESHYSWDAGADALESLYINQCRVVGRRAQRINRATPEAI